MAENFIGTSAALQQSSQRRTEFFLDPGGIVATSHRAGRLKANIITMLVCSILHTSIDTEDFFSSGSFIAGIFAAILNKCRFWGNWCGGELFYFGV